MEVSREGGSVSEMYQKQRYCVERETGASWVQIGSVLKSGVVVVVVVVQRAGDGWWDFGWRVGIGRGRSLLR